MISSTGGSDLLFMIKGWAEKGRTGGVIAIPTVKFDLHRLGIEFDFNLLSVNYRI
jgi:hypothetical protein